MLLARLVQLCRSDEAPVLRSLNMSCSATYDDLLLHFSLGVVEHILYRRMERKAARISGGDYCDIGNFINVLQIIRGNGVAGFMIRRDFVFKFKTLF